MKLHLIVGCREFLTPRLVDAEALEGALRALTPAARLPQVRWILPEGPVHDHRVLFADETDAPRRVELFLEYLEDTAGPDDELFVLAPYEPVRAGEGGLSDPRTQHLLERARARFGTGVVACRRLLLSRETELVLRRLHEERGLAPAPGFLRERVPVTTTYVDGIPGADGLAETLRRNYGRAVVELCGELVTRTSVFGGVGRANRVAQLLDDDQLILRSDLDADRILAELKPGGELYELFVRPLPRAGYQVSLFSS